MGLRVDEIPGGICDDPVGFAAAQAGATPTAVPDGTFVNTTVGAEIQLSFNEF